MKKVLMIIPARGGSKGIPRKNLVELGGFPLISYVVRTALSAGLDADVVVSTDDEEIKEAAETFGAWVPFIRPSELASDTATTYVAVKHAVETLISMGHVYEDVILLQPTQPFVTPESIRGAHELYLEHDKVGVAGVSPVMESPILMRTMDENHQLSPLLSGSSTIRRQDRPNYYRVNGAVYVNSVKDILAGPVSFNDNPLGFEMGKVEGFDIDTPLDMKLASALLGII